MNSGDVTTLHQFVDDALGLLEQIDMLRMPHPNMPLAMRDSTKEVEDDWIPWKPVGSTVTAEDIQELEQKINLRYPALYVEFLRYKHFYELFPTAEINFFEHGIEDWKQVLLDRYFQSWLPEKLIKQGYIYFADYSDWGIVCFDTNEQQPDDFDCPVIMIDHELLYDNPTPKETLYPSFAEMMRSLTLEQRNPEPPEE